MTLIAENFCEPGCSTVLNILRGRITGAEPQQIFVNEVCTMVQTNYSYTDLNQIQSVSDAVYSSQFVYNDIGNLIQEMLGNGVEVNYDYDDNNRLTVVDHVYGQNTLASFTYILDNMGNPLGVTDKNGGTTAYTYDDLYQLIEVEYPDQETVTYTYDAVGNRTGANDIDYTYNAANQLIDVDGTTYSYNDNGCLTSAGGKQLSYDYEDQLVEIDDGINIINYFYDGDGNRTGQTVAGEVYRSVEFTYDMNSILPLLIAEADDQGNEYNYIYGNRLLERSGTDGPVFYHQDSLGSTSVVSSVYGEILFEYDYDVWGGLRNTSGSGYNPIQFTGEYFDDPGGLLYLRARYYDPAIGRFITPDSYTGNLNDPLSQNLYAYCGNNPVAYVDPSGHITICQWDDLLRGMLDGSAEALEELIHCPKTIYYLVTGLLSGRISGEEYLAAMHQIFAPIRNIIANSRHIFTSDQTTDAEVYQYGRDAGTTLTDVSLSAVGGVGVVKATAKTTSALSKVNKATRGLDRAESVLDGFSSAGANGKITGYTKHGLHQAIGRDGGKGVSPKAILDTVKNPTKVVPQNGNLGTTYKYVSDKAVVVLNEDGKVVTTYAKGSMWTRGGK